MNTTTEDKLACFIHSTTLELWKDTFLIELLDYLKSSKLLERLEYLCIVNNGQQIDTKMIEQTYAPAKVVYFSENTMDFENTTIRLLHVFAKMNPTYNILYMHTKGISYTKEHVFYPGVKAWNHYMMYSLVQNYKKCIQLLKVYDTVGCNFRPEEHGNGQHYSGNFWWASARYVKHLPIHYLKDKYHPEFWLLQNQPLYFNIHTIENMYEQAYPETNYTESVQQGFDNNVLYCKVGFPCTGLCNQLYNIANTLCIAASQNGQKVVILDDFLNDVDLQSMKKISVAEVLDLDTMNESLKSYGIVMIYKHHVKMTLDRVEYGLKDVQVIDATNAVRECFYKPNHLYIPQWTGMNDVIGMDPCPQMRKQIYVYYSLNDIPFMKTFHERKLIFNGPVEINHIQYDSKPANYILTLEEPWLTRINRDDSRELKPLFDHFLKMFRFHSYYYEQAQLFIDTTLQQKEQTVNVWHVRNEPDAIGHWSRLNHMCEEEYRIQYETRFIETIRKHIHKDCMNIALTAYVDDNPIIDKLRQDGYQIVSRPKIPEIGREMNAIIDMLMGYNCNGTFLGNINPHEFQGSTFSYVLYNYLKDQTYPMRKKVRILTINMDNILEDVHTLSG